MLPSGAPQTAPIDGVLQLEERENLLHTWLADQQGVALVARPDRYVFGVAQSASDLYELVSQLFEALTPDDPLS